jgi:ribosomal protein L29
MKFKEISSKSAAELQKDLVELRNQVNALEFNTADGQDVRRVT